MKNNLQLTKSAILACCLFSLSACEEQSIHNGPGGLTPEDAKALDEAALKLDQKALQAPIFETGPQKAPDTSDTAK